MSPDIFWWGEGLPREWVGAKKFGMSLETQGIKLFWRDIPGFCRDIPEAPKKFEKKMFGFNSRPLIKLVGVKKELHNEGFCTVSPLLTKGVNLHPLNSRGLDCKGLSNLGKTSSWECLVWPARSLVQRTSQDVGERALPRTGTIATATIKNCPATL